MAPARRDIVAGGLICMGVVLIVLAFLLAFTIFGEVSAVVGALLVVLGARQTGRRALQKSPDHSGSQ
jgi:hypothetical protein